MPAPLACHWANRDWRVVQRDGKTGPGGASRLGAGLGGWVGGKGGGSLQTDEDHRRYAEWRNYGGA